MNRIPAERLLRRPSPLRILLCVAVLCGCMAGAISGTAAGASPGQGIRKQLDGVVGVVNSLKVPGYVIGVAGDGLGRYQRVAGLAAPNQPMSARDHFRIGSITKTFTATVILQLVDRHKLHLNDLLSKWEPHVPNANQITVQMLLDMTSGIWDEGGAGSLLAQWWIDNCFGTSTTNCGQYWRPQQLVDLAIQQGAAQPPGTYYYSDTNYMILGIIARRVTGKPLSWLMQHLIFNRLHLRQTSAPTRSLNIPRPATAGYRPVYVKGTLTGYAPSPVASPSTYFGAGNLISTLHDLRIWARAVATGKLLKRRTQRERLRLMSIGGPLAPLAGTGVTTGLPLSYGLGIAGLGGMLGHNGQVIGFNADMWYIPRRHATVVVLFNSETACQTEIAPDAIAVSLAQAAFAGALNQVPATPVTCPVPTG